jgi:hypothetical protein
MSTFFDAFGANPEVKEKLQALEKKCQELFPSAKLTLSHEVNGTIFLHVENPSLTIELSWEKNIIPDGTADGWVPEHWKDIPHEPLNFGGVLLNVDADAYGLSDDHYYLIDDWSDVEIDSVDDKSKFEDIAKAADSLFSEIKLSSELLEH